jgi:glycosyltransferase involved in cell wall biosynthesis
MPQRSWAVRLAKQWKLGRLFRRCDAFLTIGTHNEAFYKHFGADPARFVSVPHAVDNVQFASGAARWRRRRAEVRARWALPENGCVFLLSGKLIGKKRPLDAIAAIGSLERSIDAALLVVGDGEWRLRCERQARAVAGDRVRFVGFANQSEMPRAYAASDVLVMPSDRGETWGLSVNEAMACGLPAIVSDRVGAAPDLVVPGLTGRVFAAGDVDALAGHMTAMAADPQRRRLMGLAAKQHMDGYGVEAAVDGVLHALEQVTGNLDARRRQFCVPAGQWQPAPTTRGAA